MSQLQRSRLLRRLKQHHLSLFAATCISVGALYFTRPYRDVLTRASFATAYPAMALLVVTLLMGPLKVLRKKRNPVSSDLRRDFGIWAGIVGILHSVLGQNVHLRGRPWLYYVYEHPSRHKVPLRHDLFGLANHTGLVSFLILCALLATSNDYSLRRLGTPRWKQLQRWNYAVFALVTIHALEYQNIEKQKLAFVAVVVFGTATTVALQILGYWRRKVGMGVKAAALTAGSERSRVPE